MFMDLSMGREGVILIFIKNIVITNRPVYLERIIAYTLCVSTMKWYLPIAYHVMTYELIEGGGTTPRTYLCQRVSVVFS